jgi:hypothetical protein
LPSVTVAKSDFGQAELSDDEHPVSVKAEAITTAAS